MSLFLVTGGAGFIGSNIVKELLKRGEKVRVLDNFSFGKHENISSVRDDIELIEGDIRDAEAVQKAVSGVDYVLHQAALRSVPRSMDYPLEYNEVNVTGTLTLLTAAQTAGVKRFVFASSSSVYGASELLPQQEHHAADPITPYAANKLTGEYYGRVANHSFGLETVSLRYFNVFGPHQDPGSEYAVVIPKFILNMIAGEPAPVHGDGKQSRDFTYVENVVQANILSCYAENVAGEVFNIACGSANTVLDIVETINELMGTDIQPAFESSRKGDIRHTFADISKAQRLLKFQPTVSFADGIAKTFEWFKRSVS